VGSELLRLIDADTAHAIKETAKATGKAIDAAAGTKFLAKRQQI
jgi:hypothetical protein